MVDTQDGLGELVQSVVSTVNHHQGLRISRLGLPQRTDIIPQDDALLCLNFETQGSLLVIHLHPNDKIYIVDLHQLGPAALELRHDFVPTQLHSTTSVHTELDPLQRSLLEIGQLPSLKGILESPSICKVVFDSEKTAPALKVALGITVRGLQDIQVMEMAGRPLPASLYFHRKDFGRHVKSRSLRCCLE